MKKGFTLVELLVVTAVIAILLTVTVRILGAGQEASMRNVTVARLQRIENALSGYFAAFGSYPPVANNFNHNVYARYDASNGTQNGEDEELVWANVQKVCAAQPVAARFPFPSDEGVDLYIENLSKEASKRVSGNDSQFKGWQKENIREKLNGGFSALKKPTDVTGDWKKDATWGKVKIFQFGLMSYLLPRLMFMTQCVSRDGDFSYDDLGSCAQWTANNRFSAHPNTGRQFGDWEQQQEDGRLVKRFPSQSVCARWMPNFEGIVSGNPLTSDSMRFFGIDTSDGKFALNLDDPSELAENVYLDQNRTILDTLTVKDGWGREFYYYSPPPYQSYRLWSAGADALTFPAWIPLSTLKNDTDRKTAANWMADDIMYLSK